MSIHFSSNSDEWETPKALFDELNKEFNFDFDCCATAENTKADNWSENLQEFVKYVAKCGTPHKTFWMNPPYSRGKQKKMIGYANQLACMGKTIVCLLPARTDTLMFHKYIWDNKTHKPRTGVEVRFLKGRVKFEMNGEPIFDAKGRAQPAPFPSMIVIFR